MSKQDDWTKTLNDVTALVREGMDVEDAKNLFADIHGFRPDGKRIPLRQRKWFRPFS